MKKAVKVTLGIVGGIIVVAAIAGGADKSNTQTTNSNSSTTQQQASDKQSETMTIKNSTYSENNGLKQVVGEITNNSTSKHSATLKSTFYAADGSIKGTASGAVNDVAGGETKTFTLMTMDEVAGYTEMKVQVDTLL